MVYKKIIKRTARKIYKKAKPYASKKKGYKNRMKLYNEVNQIKKMMNAEKKTKNFVSFGNGVAQLANGGEGIFAISLIPTISLGTGFDARTGRSIKLSGAYLRGQFKAQTNTINRLKYTMTIIKYLGKRQTLTEITTGMYLQDNISGLRDYFASRNPDSYTDYRIIAQRNYYVQPDSITGQTGITDFMMPLKLDHHIRYSLNTGDIEEGEIFLIIRGDSGDSGTAATGAFFQISNTLTYYDN